MRCSTTIVCLLLLLLGCCQRGTDAPPATAENVPAASGDATDPTQDATRKIVRTGELALAVDDLDKARTSVLAAMKAAGGHVAQDKVLDHGRTVQRVLCLRVPNAGFETLVATIERLGKVEHLHVTADDVTAQWIDLDARIRAKKQMEARFLELFARAASIDQVMHVERELGTVRAEIEAMESTLRVMNDRIALSTLTVTLRSTRADQPLAPAPDFTQALASGWTAVLRCLFVILTVWPLLALAAAALVYWRMRKPHPPELPAAS